MKSEFCKRRKVVRVVLDSDQSSFCCTLSPFFKLQKSKLQLQKCCLPIKEIELANPPLRLYQLCLIVYCWTPPKKNILLGSFGVIYQYAQSNHIQYLFTTRKR